MKQYCRYCSHACLTGDYSIYCEETNRIYDEKYAKHTNKCKKFDFNPNDLLRYDENGFAQYKPREKVEKLEQIQMDWSDGK